MLELEWAALFLEDHCPVSFPAQIKHTRLVIFQVILKTLISFLILVLGTHSTAYFGWIPIRID